MQGIFKRQNTVHKGSLASDRAVLTALQGGNAVGGNAGPASAISVGIVQNLSAQFMQNISRIYDVSNFGTARDSVPVYYVGGRSQGNATIQRVVGPNSDALCDFYQSFGDVCNPANLQFTLGTGCGSDNATNTMSYEMTGCVLQSMQIGVAANDMIPNENVQMIFANMACQTNLPNVNQNTT